MTIIKRDKCDICGRQRVSTVAADGRAVCKECRKDHKEYRSHWFVKSLVFKPPGLPPLPRKHKSLPGQQDLFG